MVRRNVSSPSITKPPAWYESADRKGETFPMPPYHAGGSSSLGAQGVLIVRISGIRHCMQDSGALMLPMRDHLCIKTLRW